MSVRFFASVIGMAFVAGTTTLGIPPVSGQAPRAANTAEKWTPPRTSWGDPDLHGWFTNLNENGTPLERPDQFARHRLEDVNGKKLAALKQEVQKRMFATFQGPLHGPGHWWQEDLNLIKGSQAWLVIDPPDGKIPPLTAQAKVREAARVDAKRNSGRGPVDSWEDLTLYDRCITRGLPGSMMPTIYGNSYQILQTPGYVTIRYEMVHETRVIPLDGRPHVASSVRSYMGDPRGHWEDDTLVVETTNFKDEAAYRGANAATLRQIERFTRIARDKVKWTVTVDDPSTWTKPWTFAMPLTMDDSQPVLEYACHEGNYALRNILSAARAEEKRTAEQAAENK